MAKLEISTKRIALSKANAQMVAVLAIASAVTVFCLVAAHSLWGQNAYLRRVNGAKQDALTQLEANKKAVSALEAAYQGFVSTSTNAIGGSTTGPGDNSGDNAKIVLDALPSKYDFPALTSSLEKILSDRHLNVDSITGTDDELAQQQANATAAPNPQPVAMPFSFTVSKTNYSAIQDLVNVLQRSIRPMQIDSMTISGGGDNMQLVVNAHTYYQQEKSMQITKKVIK